MHPEGIQENVESEVWSDMRSFGQGNQQGEQGIKVRNLTRLKERIMEQLTDARLETRDENKGNTRRGC
jgi:hypothetical protein